MATTTHETTVGPTPVSSRSGTLAKVLLVLLFVLQVWLRIVNPDYWWDNAFWTFVTIALGVAFFVTWLSARRRAPGSVWGLGWFAVILIFLVMIWM